jgi:cytochrome b561
VNADTTPDQAKYIGKTRPLSRYSAVAILLHWLIAALIVLNLWLGVTMGHLHGLAKFNNFQLHKSVGITVLLLSVLRLGWRLANPPPPYGPGMAPWEKTLSGAVHWAFYIIMIGLPLSGWLAVSASPMGLPTLLYHIGGFPGIPWPDLPIAPGLPLDQKKAVDGAASAIHHFLGFSAEVLIVLHVAGALKHQFFDPHPVLPRMLPFLKRRG